MMRIGTWGGWQGRWGWCIVIILICLGGFCARSRCDKVKIDWWLRGSFCSMSARRRTEQKPPLPLPSIKVELLFIGKIMCISKNHKLIYFYARANNFIFQEETNCLLSSHNNMIFIFVNNKFDWAFEMFWYTGISHKWN